MRGVYIYLEFCIDPMISRAIFLLAILIIDEAEVFTKGFTNGFTPNFIVDIIEEVAKCKLYILCLLYTSDAADE